MQEAMSVEGRSQPQAFERTPSACSGQKQLGQWECDTVISSQHKGVIVAMIERKRLVVLRMAGPYLTCL